MNDRKCALCKYFTTTVTAEPCASCDRLKTKRNWEPNHPDHPETYRNNIVELIDAQRSKGISKYGGTLEENTTLTDDQRIRHVQEELVDGLMYCEHLKAALASDGMTANDYQRAALRTAGDDKNAWLINGVMGLCGEAGECIDIIKKTQFQGHELDKEHLAEELGDVAWYLAVTAKAIGYNLSDIFKMNVEKLKKRYPEGFDKDRSINREVG